jgi:oligopeptide/dipeptide ABC transporter ATP-binding protein
MPDLLLDVSGLSVEIASAEGLVRPVRDVSLAIERGGSVALVGESGSGKTMTCLALVNLLAAPARLVSGRVLYDGTDLARLSEADLQKIRGRRIGFIFQDPTAALDPLFTVGEQIGETLRAHLGASRSEARARTLRLMEELEIPGASTRIADYPHQFSGGMRQRISIAIALACEPELLIADEPTTALDVTTERTILELIARIRRERNLALLLVTHSLAIAAVAADHVCVMYGGRIVESGAIDETLRRPGHPYTEALRACALSVERGTSSRLATIPGTVPNLIGELDRCSFAERCPYADEPCYSARPPLFAAPAGEAACFHVDRELQAVW